MMKRQRKIKQILKEPLNLLLILIVIFAFALRIMLSASYDLNAQHDPHFHIEGMQSLINGEIPNYYVPSIYLAWYLMHKPLITIFTAHSAPPEQLMRAYVGFGNLTLLLILLLGLVQLGRELKFGRRQILLWIALVGTLVPIQRSLSMVRPENIQLALSPWVFFLGIKWIREKDNLKSKYFWIYFLAYQLICAVVIFQKISGAIIVVTSLISLFLFYKQERRKHCFLLISIFLILIMVFSFNLIWEQMSGVSILDSPANQISTYSNSAPLSFYFSLPLDKVLLTPYRNELRASMFGILIADFYGDYWRYGYNHYPESLPPKDNPAALFRQRAGSIVSITFFLWLLGAFIYLGKLAYDNPSARKNILTLFVSGFLMTLLGFLLLGASAQIQFNPDKADIIKWEYIIFGVPYMLLPLVYFSSQIKQKGILLAYYASICIFTLAGIFQSGNFLS